MTIIGADMAGTVIQADQAVSLLPGDQIGINQEGGGLFEAMLLSLVATGANDAAEPRECDQLPSLCICVACEDGVDQAGLMGLLVPAALLLPAIIPQATGSSPQVPLQPIDESMSWSVPALITRPTEVTDRVFATAVTIEDAPGQTPDAPTMLAEPAPSDRGLSHTAPPRHAATFSDADDGKLVNEPEIMTVEVALGKANGQPITDHARVGHEQPADKNLVFPSSASPTPASAMLQTIPQAMLKAIPPIPDGADSVPVAGNVFQRETLRIQLAPTDLGQITLQVSVHGRQVQAALSVESQELGAYLAAAGQGALNDAMRSHGLQVEEFRVELLDFSASRNEQGQDAPEFQGRRDALPNRLLFVAAPTMQEKGSSELESVDVTGRQGINVFA